MQSKIEGGPAFAYINIDIGECRAAFDFGLHGLFV